MAGPVGFGKTLLNRGILGALFGGFAEAGAFLKGDDKFNSELFSVGYRGRFESLRFATAADVVPIKSGIVRIILIPFVKQG